VNLIRFDYEDKADMFDRHYYNKGGRILNMLRIYMRDDAFFASLQLYLETNQFKSVEAHQLRLAFEEVTGEDLNWFFNQWFFSKGHPLLKIDYEYDATKKIQYVTVEQQQDFNETPLYKLPVKIDIYAGGSKTTHDVVIDQVKQTFEFEVSQTPELVNFDADKVLLCEKEDNKPLASYVKQYYKAPQYMDRLEAIKECSDTSDIQAVNTLIDAMGDKYWNLRQLAIRKIGKGAEMYGDKVKAKLTAIAKNDEKSLVRAAALDALSKHFSEDESVLSIYQHALNDSSYAVITSGALGVATVNKEKGLEIATNYASKDKFVFKQVAAEIYAMHGDKKHETYFKELIPTLKGEEGYQAFDLYSEFLVNQNDHAMIMNSIPYCQKTIANGNGWLPKLGGYAGLNYLFGTVYGNLEEQAESLSEEEKDKMIEDLKLIQATYLSLWENETDKEKLKKYLN